MHKLIAIILFFCTFSVQAIPLKAQHHGHGQLHAQNLLVMLHHTQNDPNEFVNLVDAFNQRGFYPISVDFRSSVISHWQNAAKGIKSMNDLRAKSFPEADEFYGDIVQFLKDLRATYPGKQIVVAASGNMAEQSLKAARDYPSVVDGLLLFTPEFSSEENRNRLSKATRVPVFVTASDDQIKEVQRFVIGVQTRSKMAYLPEGPSSFGAYALQNNTQEKEFTWQALDYFIYHYFPAPGRANS